MEVPERARRDNFPTKRAPGSHDEGAALGEGARREQLLAESWRRQLEDVRVERNCRHAGAENALARRVALDDEHLPHDEAGHARSKRASRDLGRSHA